MYKVINHAINGTYLSADASAGATSVTVDTPGNLGIGTAYIWDEGTPVGETVTISNISGSTITLSALMNSYTIANRAVITMAAGILADGTVKEFNLKIKARYAKICYIGIVQHIQGPMDVVLEVFEKSGIDESVRHTMHYAMVRRQIELDADEGGQYGESLMYGPIPYKDEDTVDEERTYNLHCRLTNEDGGTASDFTVFMKLADSGEMV